MEMLDRRTLLGAAAVLPLLPKGLRPQWKRGQDEPSPLSAALADGERLAKPVLILRIPDHESQMHSQGEVLGLVLHHSGRALLEALPLAEIVCARQGDLQALRPKWQLDGAPFAWLVETPGASAPFTPVHAKLGPEPEIRWDDKLPIDEVQRRLAAWVRPLTEALLKALVGSENRIQQRAAAVNAAGHFRVASRARLLAEPLEAKASEVRAGAALLYRASKGMDPEDCPARIALRRHARARLIEAPPPGSRWATEDGCSLEIDGDDAPGVECGMGYVPEGSRRLLWFYTRAQ